MNIFKELYKTKHPRILILFYKIAWSNKVKFNDLRVDSSLEVLCTRLHLRLDSTGIVSLSLDISDKLDDKSRNVRRLYNCFKFWIPYSLELLKSVDKSFSLSLNASDWNNKNFLSMTSDLVTNIIPDEYSMRNHYKQRYNNHPMPFHKFKKNWLERQHQVFWRGSTTGGGVLNTTKDLFKLKRVILCQLYNHNNSESDIKYGEDLAEKDLETRMADDVTELLDVMSVPPSEIF